MQVTHLAHDDRAIKCKECGKMFEVRGDVISDPVRLLECKEGIAAKHTCRNVMPMVPVVRVWRRPSGEQIAAYFTREIRRHLPA